MLPFFMIETLQDLHRFQSQSAYGLYFSLEDCGVCHALFPRISEVFKLHGIPLAKLDAARFETLAGQLLIFSVPTLLLFYEGREIYRESRFIQVAKIDRLLDQIGS